MNQLVTQAIVGTAHQSEQPMTTGTSIDDLLPHLATHTPERRLLLVAGAQALYQQAGLHPYTIETLSEPAAPEQLPDCTPAAANLISSLLQHSRQQEFVLEALQRLQKAQQRLPFTLLASALTYGTQHANLRSALFPVLGERGLWLSQQNPAWNWVAELQPVVDAPLDRNNLQIHWQEGKQGERKQALRVLRTHQPAQAREWLSDIWKQEAANVREALLETLAINLSGEDEEFLNKALEDRSATVRTLAVRLLTQIPGSALLQRMLARADALLPIAQGKITVMLPQSCPKDWQKDGIALKPPKGLGERYWWLQQVLALIPPAHWEHQFALPAQEILRQLTTDENKSLNTVIAPPIAEAAVLHHDQDWILLLWNTARQHLFTQQQVLLLRHLPAEYNEQKAIEESHHFPEQEWIVYLEALPRPWSQTFSQFYLKTLRNHFATTIVNYNTLQLINQTLILAASALAPECLIEAQLPWTIMSENQQYDWYIQNARQNVDRFIENIQLRIRLLEEI
ncbi:DUF5691 domain-containing protein [Tengunoibacter tsumagoiensis]|uniref:Uncharacterized protein n=1 Tax=Tengunoibacter tsumagoiensis TaxID=2014871 RepID=A0A401ZZM0_9CHLR|nr:DUF5691 domain-containing protein [Tengunoibacter tsumagoiensis]GCE12286.1 hypothetical protein KTT_21450 [Tengunoibacter tsumagoiensis]